MPPELWGSFTGRDDILAWVGCIMGKSLFFFSPGFLPSLLLDLGPENFFHPTFLGRGPFVRPPESGRPNRGSRNSLASAFRVLSGAPPPCGLLDITRDRGGGASADHLYLTQRRMCMCHRCTALWRGQSHQLWHIERGRSNCSAKQSYSRTESIHFICSSCARRPACQHSGGRGHPKRPCTKRSSQSMTRGRR